MTTKPVIPRAQAHMDVDSAIGFYLQENAPAAASGFIDALEQAYTHIGRHASTGSPRFGQTLGLPGLRAWPLSRHPFLVFYLERQDHVDVWRVLHTRRDIPERMRDPDTP